MEGGETGRERKGGDKAFRSVCPFVCVSPCSFSVAEEAAAAEGGGVGRGRRGDLRSYVVSTHYRRHGGDIGQVSGHREMSCVLVRQHLLPGATATLARHGMLARSNLRVLFRQAKAAGQQM